RPATAACRPRATVSTSGSSGMNLTKITQLTAAPANPRQRRGPHSSGGTGRLAQVLVIVRGRREGRDDQRMLFEPLEGDLDSFFQLRVMPGSDRSGLVFHLDVRRDAAILHFPFAVQTVNGHSRRGNAAAIHQRRIVVDADQSSPSAGSDQSTDLILLEHPR